MFSDAPSSERTRGRNRSIPTESSVPIAITPQKQKAEAARTCSRFCSPRSVAQRMLPPFPNSIPTADTREKIGEHRDTAATCIRSFSCPTKNTSAIL